MNKLQTVLVEILAGPFSDKEKLDYITSLVANSDNDLLLDSQITKIVEDLEKKDAALGESLTIENDEKKQIDSIRTKLNNLAKQQNN